MGTLGPPPIVRSQIVPLVYAELQRREMDADAFVRRFDVSVVDPKEFLVRLDHLHALLDAAARELGDDELGVFLAVRRGVGTHGVAEYCWRTAPTIRDGVLATVRFYNLLNDVALLTLEDEGEQAVLTEDVRAHPWGFGRHANDFFTVLVFQEFERLAGARPRVEVRMPHPRPSSDDALRAALGEAVISYGAPSLSMHFDRAWLARPLATADAALHETLLRGAEELVRGRRGQAGEPGKNTLVQSLREHIAGVLQSGAHDIATLARAHAMSVRTLQRRIAESGTTLSMLVDGVREERGRALMLEGRHAVGEVATILGYADAAAFVRAFRRWTGTTPAAFRRAGTG